MEGKFYFDLPETTWAGTLKPGFFGVGVFHEFLLNLLPSEQKAESCI